LLIDSLKQIALEAAENPELVQTAPHSTRIQRLDETGAARRPVLRWKGPVEAVELDAAAKEW
jgi:glycine dehydrogenase subunit 2